MPAVTDPDPLPISLVAHTAFCPRRAWLEASGERTRTSQVEEGVRAHRRVDRPGASRPGDVKARPVHSARLGVVGRCDTVRTDGDGIRIIEHKATPVSGQPVIRPQHRVQLALQRLCLEEEGATVLSTAVHFTESGTTVDVILDNDDLTHAESLVHRTRAICESTTAPEPLCDAARCHFCSHQSVCLPDERRLEPVHRRILVADPDGQVLHVTVPGARASIRSGRVSVRKGGDLLGEVPFERVQALVVHGNVDVSSALLRELLWRDRTIVWCSGTGRVYGWAVPGAGPNGIARVRQHERSARGDVPMAAAFIEAKIGNQATLLRRNGHGPIARLREIARRCRDTTTTTELLGLEGSAAKIYFSCLPTMITDSVSEYWLRRWPGRQGRGAADPLNAALNYAYGMLTTDVLRAVVSAGLDPHAGFLHSSSRNKPALVLDLMEEFRAPVADSCILSALNNGVLSESDLSEATGVPRLLPRGRSKLVRAYERRVTTEFTHPVFGYRATWRRAMEIQARLVLGVLDGTQPAYKGVRIR